MSEDDTDRASAPTRRDAIKYGGTIVAGGLLAGCASDSEQDGTPTGTDTSSATETTTTEDEAYTAELAPAGKVRFESPPEEVFSILSHHTGMALALGRGDSINAMHAPGYVESLYDKVLHHLDGVSVDWEGLYSSWPPTKEKLYALDSDVHLADPAKVASADGWTREDVQEIEEEVAPWIGNTYSAAHEEPPGAWSEEYRYYTLWEIFEQIAAVFGERRRYEALAEVHGSMLDSLQQSLPPESERPSAAMVLFSTQDESMWGYEINQAGYYAAHTRPLGATDALAQAFGSGFGGEGDSKIDHEALLEADPDVLLVLGPMSSYHDIAEIRNSLESDPVASEITAVQEGRVYTQGMRRQGPILNLFQLEMTAKQLYPDQFGQWPGYVDGEPYPEIPEEERLFDRDRVANVVTGEF